MPMIKSKKKKLFLVVLHKVERSNIYVDIDP